MMPDGFYNMDCMKGMREFPDKYFDLAIVDPPYGGGDAGRIHEARGKYGCRNGRSIRYLTISPRKDDLRSGLDGDILYSVIVRSLTFAYPLTTSGKGASGIRCPFSA